MAGDRLPRILVVDDDKDCLLVIQDLLHREGFDPVIASDGYRALGLAVTQKFDAVITDLNMPEINGIQLTTHMRSMERQLNCPIFFMSSTLDQETIAKLKTMHVADFIFKPRAADELVKKLRAALKPTVRKPLAYHQEMINLTVNATTEVLKFYLDNALDVGQCSIKETRQVQGVGTAIIDLFGRRVFGSLALTFDRGMHHLLVGKMLGITSDQIEGHAFMEVVSEMANQVAGAMKVSLRDRGIIINIGLPHLLAPGESTLTHRVTGRVLQIPLRHGQASANVELCLGNSLVDENIIENPDFHVFIADP